MRPLMRIWIVCVGVACTGIAQAAPSGVAQVAPSVAARENYKRAAQLDDNGDAEKALVLIDKGLAIAPKDLALLGLKGSVLLKLHNYTAALAAYQAYLDAGATGANRREAQKIVNNLGAVQATFLEITLANGPAAIYLDSKTQGVFCTAAPSCNQAVLPGEYKVIAERSGFERWTGPVVIENGKTAKLAVTLVETPSLLIVHVAQPGARVTVDDTAYDAPTKVAAGEHRIVVTLAGHVDARLDAVAHEGKPVELDVVLTPRVAIHVEPPGAALVLDDKPVAIEDGGLAIPPGAHVLVVRAPGFQDRRIEIPAVRAPDDKLAVELAPVPVPVPQPAPVSSPPQLTQQPQGDDLGETTAIALSLGGTVASWVMVAASSNGSLVAIGAFGTLFAPSLGHWYARSYFTRGLGVRLLGVVAVVAGVAVAASECSLFSGKCEESAAFPILLIGGAALYVGGTIDDIATAPSKVRRYNHRFQNVAIVPVIRGDSSGFAIAGRF
jgi:hypothetical protein